LYEFLEIVERFLDEERIRANMELIEDRGVE